MTSWPEDRLRRLRKHFDDGLTLAESGERLGVSYAAVLKQRRRLGLVRRRPPPASVAASGQRPGEGGSSPARPFRARFAGAPGDPPPEILEPGADLSRALPLTALGPRQCRWPLESTAVEPSIATPFCAQPTAARRSFCPAHDRAAFGRTQRCL